MPANQPGPPPVRSSAVARQDQNRSVASTAEQTYEQVADILRNNRGAEARAMREMLGGEAMTKRFLAVVMSALASNSDILRRATPISIVQAIKDAAALGLEPMTDQCAIVVYGNQAKAMPQWRGYLTRIRNSGKVSEIDCQLVYERDDFAMSLGTDPSIHHVPARIIKDGDQIVSDRGNYYGAYAWALMPSGKTIIEFMSTAEIEQVRRQFSRSADDGPWVTSWGEMARKTVIRRLAKRLPGAAVDVLLDADSRADAAADAVAKEAAKLRDDLADVRELALGRVGALPAGDPVQPVPAVEQPAVAVDAAQPSNLPPMDPDAEPPDDPLDPDLAAGMALLERPPDRRR